MEFITSPQLPDIISYIVVFAMFIYEYFVKLFVKKNNRITLLSVDTKMAKINKMEKDLQDKAKELEEERKKWEQERQEVKQEIELLKKAIRTSSNNSHELVANGTAHEIAEMLPISEGNESVKEENVDEQ